ncbi:DNA primase [Paracoccus pacificus]|uniref:DNA primase n=1 Tax=Paracoccus pacificus TaxID=1463598 RepID=A0ABW4R5X8_9RHOB
MSLPPGFLDELRDRVPISRIVGRKVTWDLRKSNQGKGDWWAPCPFHHEKTASFHVDDQKGFFYCFGCQAKGDALSFLREAEGLGFMEAVEVMASEAGLQMPERDPRAQERSDRRTQLVDVMEAAVRHFRLQLQTGPAGAAREYLERRGLDAATLERFEIGFAPDQRGHMTAALKAKGISDAQLVETGLAIRPDDGGAIYDRFRGRIMFPIRDARGRAIAFGGRAMDPNARAKYLNSPETPLFDKGRNLYNLGPARAAVGKGAPLLVAEGYMDVIALARAGFEGAVAPLGTAITEEQLRLMWRVAPEPVIALDGDAAGLRAAMRLIDLAMPMIGPGQALRFALLPAGQDPDDLIRTEGPGAMARILDAARPMVDLLWRRETEGRDFDSPERKAALDKTLRETIARIEDKSTRDHYTTEIRRLRWELFGGRKGAGRLSSWGTQKGGSDAEGARRGGRSALKSASAPARASVFVAGDPGEPMLEAMVLAICARYPELVPQVCSRLERLEPVDLDRAALVHDLLAGAPISEAGRAALETILSDAHVRTIPPLRHAGDAAKTAIILGNALDRLESFRAARAEIARAEAEIAGLADEGLTWRVGQLARARDRADHPPMEDTSDLGENRSELSREMARLKEEFTQKTRS